ncbi:MAG: hypothetical protein QM755_13470 [Luteolibacter sp.]
MRIRISHEAWDDLLEGCQFYETQEPGLGAYFTASLRDDIEGLKLTGGIHRVVYRDLHRLLSKRFPFAIYYRCDGDFVDIHAVLDCRRSPAWVRRRLSE